MSGYSHMSMAAGSHGAPSKRHHAEADYLGTDLIDGRRGAMNETELISRFQDARRIEGDLSTKHLYDYWGPMKNERLDQTDLMPRIALKSTMQFPYASPEWFAKERQLQKDSIAAGRGPRAHGGDAVARRFDAGYSLHDAQAMEGEYRKDGRPMRVRVSGDEFAYVGHRTEGRSSPNALAEAVLGGGGLSAGTREMLSAERGSLGISGDMVRDSLPFRRGPIRLSGCRSCVGGGGCPPGEVCDGSCCTPIPGLAGIPPSSIRPEQNPTSFDLDKHSYHSYKRGLPAVCERDPMPSMGAWDSKGYLRGVHPPSGDSLGIAGGRVVRLMEGPLEDVRSSPGSAKPWAEPLGSQPWVSEWSNSRGKDVYMPKGLSEQAPRGWVSMEHGDESSCDWGAEMFLAWNDRASQFQCTHCPPGHRPAYAECVPVKSTPAYAQIGKTGGR